MGGGSVGSVGRHRFSVRCSSVASQKESYDSVREKSLLMGTFRENLVGTNI